MPYSYVKKFLNLLLVFTLTLALIISAQSVQAHAINKSAIALLIAKNSANEVLGTGTVFVVKPEGVLVTNYHVLVDATSIQAVMSNGDQVKVKSVLKIDRVKDFALLLYPSQTNLSLHHHRTPCLFLVWQYAFPKVILRYCHLA